MVFARSAQLVKSPQALAQPSATSALAERLPCSITPTAETAQQVLIRLREVLASRAHLAWWHPMMVHASVSIVAPVRRLMRQTRCACSVNQDHFPLALASVKLARSTRFRLRLGRTSVTSVAAALKQTRCELCASLVALDFSPPRKANASRASLAHIQRTMVPVYAPSAVQEVRQTMTREHASSATPASSPTVMGNASSALLVKFLFLPVPRSATSAHAAVKPIPQSELQELAVSSALLANSLMAKVSASHARLAL